jgi:hypothetical protein
VKKSIIIFVFCIVNIASTCNALNFKQAGYATATGVGVIGTAAGLGFSFLGASALYVRANNFGDYSQIFKSNNYMVPKIATVCLLASALCAAFTKKTYNKLCEQE